MPLSNDNQDYGKKDNENQKDLKANSPSKNPNEGEMTSDNLKGKKVDADPEKETDKPADV